MENYLKLFEHAIKKQIDLVGTETALAQAKKAGLGISKDGHIVSCVGNPKVVLLRLIKFFTAGGNLKALIECSTLIDELLKDCSDEEIEESKEPDLVKTD